MSIYPYIHPYMQSLQSQIMQRAKSLSSSLKSVCRNRRTSSLKTNLFKRHSLSTGNMVILIPTKKRIQFDNFPDKEYIRAWQAGRQAHTPDFLLLHKWTNPKWLCHLLVSLRSYLKDSVRVQKLGCNKTHPKKVFTFIL